jgi:hypothetical protein
MRMVAVGGHYFLHTPVNGYCGHGLHTFDPWVMDHALTINNFEIVYRRFTTARGEPIDDPKDSEHALVWIVARKTASMGDFQIPQQGQWAGAYEAERAASESQNP